MSKRLRIAVSVPRLSSLGRHLSKHITTKLPDLTRAKRERRSVLKSLDLSPALGAAVLVPDPPASVAETTSAEQARHASQRRSLNQ